jgi:hypothetical protein
VKKWWRRSKAAEGDRDKRVGSRGVRRPGRTGREVTPPPDRRGPWDEQSEWTTRYGDPFDG